MPACPARAHSLKSPSTSSARCSGLHACSWALCLTTTGPPLNAALLSDCSQQQVVFVCTPCGLEALRKQRRRSGRVTKFAASWRPGPGKQKNNEEVDRRRKHFCKAPTCQSCWRTVATRPGSLRAGRDCQTGPKGRPMQQVADAPREKVPTFCVLRPALQSSTWISRPCGLPAQPGQPIL